MEMRSISLLLVFGRHLLAGRKHMVSYTEVARLLTPKKVPLLGDVVYLSLFGQPVLILNTATGTSDLLQKRGANYASRPTLTLRDEL